MGAVPAMIAVIDGLIRIGVKERTFEVLARSPNHLKVSSRDLPLIMSMVCSIPDRIEDIRGLPTHLDRRG